MSNRTEINERVAEELAKLVDKLEKQHEKQMKELLEGLKVLNKNYIDMKYKKEPKPASFFDKLLGNKCPLEQHQRDLVLSQIEMSKAARELRNKNKNREDNMRKKLKEGLHEIRLEYDCDYKVMIDKKRKENMKNNVNQKKAVYKRPDSSVVLGKTSKLKKSTPESRMKNRFKLKLQPKNSRP